MCTLAVYFYGLGWWKTGEVAQSCVELEVVVTRRAKVTSK